MSEKFRILLFCVAVIGYWISVVVNKGCPQPQKCPEMKIEGEASCSETTPCSLKSSLQALNSLPNTASLIGNPQT
jgi:hypothetical protein